MTPQNELDVHPLVSTHRMCEAPAAWNARRFAARNEFRFVRLVRRALEAEPAELRTRLAQWAFHRRNRMMARVGRAALDPRQAIASLGLTGKDLAAWWHERRARWFVPHDRLPAIARQLTSDSARATSLVARAEVLLDGKFPLLGAGTFDFTGPDRWRRDPLLHVTAPQTSYDRIRYLDARHVGDSKLVWEPSRFAWVYWLASAWLLTGDRKFAECFLDWTADWLRANPYPFGIHYCSSLEIALRSYAWLWALHLFEKPLAEHPALVEQILQGIWLGCSHIERTLSLYFAPNTHVLGEAFALFACGAAVPEFRESARWRRLGRTLLEEESRRQIHHDGTHRELSTCYHLYATDMYVQATLIGRQTGFGAGSVVHGAACRLAERLDAITPASGTLPQLNDCDGGRLTWFTLKPLDAVPSLRAAQMIGSRVAPHWENVSSVGYDLWMRAAARAAVTARHAAAAARPQSAARRAVLDLSGNEDQPTDAPDARRDPQPPNHMPHLPSGLPDSGLVGYRNAQGDYLLFRAGPFGYKDCPHSHDGPTGFVLHLRHQPIIVDSGVGSYTRDLELRRTMRCLGKNILQIGGRGPSEPGGWFTWSRTTDARLLAAERLEGGIWWRGFHDGFAAVCGFDVRVWRDVWLWDEGVAAIVDNWEARRSVEVSLTLTIDPSLEVDLAARRMINRQGNEFDFAIEVLRPTCAATAVGRSPDGVATERASAADMPRTSGQWPDLSQDATRRVLVHQDDTHGESATPLAVQSLPYSPTYGALGSTRALVVSPPAAPHGSIVTLVSRSGPIRMERPGLYRIATANAALVLDFSGRTLSWSRQRLAAVGNGRNNGLCVESAGL